MLKGRAIFVRADLGEEMPADDEYCTRWRSSKVGKQAARSHQKWKESNCSAVVQTHLAHLEPLSRVYHDAFWQSSSTLWKCVETIQDKRYKRFQDYLETIITVAMFQGEDREEHGSTGRELGKTVSMICSQKQVPECPVSEAEKSISSEHPKDALNTGRKCAPLNFELCVFFVVVVHCLLFTKFSRFSWRFPVSFEVRFERPSKPERFGRARSRFTPKTLAVYEIL